MKPHEKTNIREDKEKDPAKTERALSVFPGVKKGQKVS